MFTTASEHLTSQCCKPTTQMELLNRLEQSSTDSDGLFGVILCSIYKYMEILKL